MSLDNNNENNTFMCTYDDQPLFIDVVYDDEEIPMFKYHFGCRNASKDDPLKIGEMIVALESKVFNIYQLLKTEKENWTCKLNDKIEISYTVDLFNFESKEVELPKMEWEIQREYPEMFDD